MKTMELATRAWSRLEIKSVDDEQRLISGIATTPETDRMGDIVNPLGAKFAKELPLLWQHNAEQPVGSATFGKATKSGISFTATIASIPEAGPLQQLVDMAWQAVKAKLVRGVSIGFRALKYNFMDSGGIEFDETEIYELSLVTIPANASATIQTIKAMDGVRRNKGAGIALLQPNKQIVRPSGGAIQLVSRIAR